MTSETLPAEVFPWDHTEPYIPPLSASLIVVAGTSIEATDLPRQTGTPVSFLRIGELTLHVGMTDDEALAVIDRLNLALTELRDLINRRRSLR